MNILLLKGFNNYFNRIVKKYSSLADYKSNSSSYLEFTNVNFNPNDGVATELVLGGPTQTEGDQVLFWEYNGSPDYVICYDNGDNTTLIRSRWFMLESERLATGQYRCALKRDVLAEHFSEIMSSPCYVEKGYINDISNPLLYNTEGSQFNQIKQGELLLKDASNCAWLVGYIKKGLNAIQVSGTPSSLLDESQMATNIDFGDCIVYKDSNGSVVQSSTKTAVYASSFPRVLTEIKYDHAHTGGTNTHFGISTKTNVSNFGWVSEGDQTNKSFYGLTNQGALVNTNFWLPTSVIGSDPESLTNTTKNNSNIWNAFAAMCSSMRSTTISQNNLVLEANNLKSLYNGKYIYKDEVLYQLSITLNTASSEYFTNFTYNNDPNISAYFNILAANTSNFSLNSSSSAVTTYWLPARTYIIVANEVAVPGTVSTTLPASSARNGINDELYDMFAIPYNPVWAETTVNFGNTTIDSEISMFIAQRIMTQLQVQNAGTTLSGAQAYDLQLLPYCPLDLENGNLLSDFVENKDYVWVKDTNDAKKTIIFFPTEANFTKNLTFSSQITKSSKIQENDFMPLPTISSGLTHSTWYVIKDLSATISSSITGVVRVATTSRNDIILRKISKDYGTPIEEQNVNSVEINVDDNTLFFGEYVSGSYTVIKTLTKAEYETANYYYEFYINSSSFGGRYIADGLCKFLRLLDLDINSLDKKVSNEVDFVRLTSPNFNSMFEFKVAKLFDGVHYINIDCTYKPYNPYIKLNPDFSFLYGADFNDSTGLILSGDFSLSTMNNAWIQYELNNKNYQNIFNRQIQNLEVNNQIAREQLQLQNITGMITGPIGGAVGGALTGAKVGGGYGAIAGAVVGGVGGGILAGVGAAMNQDWLNRQQQEAKSYMIDMYNYQLGNIQALPQSISKSNPLTFNNKVWPIFEKFSCTSEERELFINKIKYNSMTVMAIGALNDYASSAEFDKVYVKGQLIRCEDIIDDFHVIDAIYQEVNKGFFVPQEG